MTKKNFILAVLVNSGRFRVFGNRPATTLSNNDFTSIEREITIYPNPTRNTFAISSDVAQVEIYNITGQMIRTFTNVISNQELDINNLEAGIYLVKMTDNNGTSLTKKLIKE